MQESTRPLHISLADLDAPEGLILLIRTAARMLGRPVVSYTAIDLPAAYDAATKLLDALKLNTEERSELFDPSIDHHAPPRIGYRD